MQTDRRTDGRTASGKQLVRTAVLRLAPVWLAMLFLSVCPSVRLSAQQVTAQQVTATQPIDRIVAIVGDRPILLSEVDEAINQARSQGLQVPEDSTQLQQLRRQMLGNLIDEEVVYQRARRDTSVTVTDAEVQNAVEEQYRSVRNQFHAESEFRTALQGAGWNTPEEYRRFLTDQSRRTAYGRRFLDHQRQEGKVHPGTVSEAEMRRAFEQARGRGELRRLPPTVTFKQVVVAPKPSARARAFAFARADSVRLALERGADFAAAARRLSDDPTTRDSGGDLGWFRRGHMVRQFEEAAFSLRPGAVSPVVETEYGFHLILVDRVQPGEVKARHILFAPAVADSERAAARRTADSVAVLLRAGASADSLARVYGDSAEPRSVGPTDRSQLPPGYAEALATVQAGQIVGPVPLNPETPDRTRYLVALVNDVQPEREPIFEDVREQLRAQLLDQKGLHNLIEDLKRWTYIDVRL